MQDDGGLGAAKGPGMKSQSIAACRHTGIACRCMSVREFVMGSAPKVAREAARGCAMASVRAAARSHSGVLGSVVGAVWGGALGNAMGNAGEFAMALEMLSKTEPDHLWPYRTLLLL